jgi:hypothetical protein
VFAEQPAIHQRRQILAALGGEFKTVLDQIGCCHHVRCVVNPMDMKISNHVERQHLEKKEQGGEALL